MMKEAPMLRINRLQKQKRELLDKMGVFKTLGDRGEKRNWRHKYDMLNDQVVRIIERIRKIRKRRHSGH